MRSGTKFILALFAVLILLGAWLAWITRGALRAKRELPAAGVTAVPRP